MLEQNPDFHSIIDAWIPYCVFSANSDFLVFLATIPVDQLHALLTAMGKISATELKALCDAA